MIKILTVTNHLDESIDMELGSPEKSGFLIQKIDGLGPPKADINIVENATNDGASYTSSRVNSRNITLKIKFLPNPTIEDSRLLAYKYFPIKKRIKLQFTTDNRVCYAYGCVELNDPDVFAKSSTTNISIICPDPYFYSLDTQTTIFSGIVPEFEFEFENNSVTENLIEFGEIVNLTTQTVYYTGDSEVGVTITMHAIGPATNVTIVNVGTHETIRLDSAKLISLTGSGIIAGDDITISTVSGNKFITLLRAGVTTNIINCLDKNVDWIQITRGDNLFAYTADSGTSNLQFKIENKTVYEGV